MLSGFKAEDLAKAQSLLQQGAQAAYQHSVLSYKDANKFKKTRKIHRFLLILKIGSISSLAKNSSYILLSETSEIQKIAVIVFFFAVIVCYINSYIMKGDCIMISFKQLCQQSFEMNFFKCQIPWFAELYAFAHRSQLWILKIFTLFGFYLFCFMLRYFPVSSLD